MDSGTVDPNDIVELLVEVLTASSEGAMGEGQVTILSAAVTAGTSFWHAWGFDSEKSGLGRKKACQM